MHDFFSEQIGLYNELRAFFLQYETDESRRRIEALEGYLSKHTAGTPSSMLLQGSLAFGMSEPGSDVDYIYVHKKISVIDIINFEHGLSCFLGENSYRQIPVSRLGQIDLSRIASQDDGEANFHLLARETCRWISTGIILGERIEYLLADVEELRQGDHALNEFIKTGVMTGGYQQARSFRKYSERLTERGIMVPQEIKEKMSEYVELLVV